MPLAQTREDFQRTVRGLLESRNAITEFEMDAVFHQVAFDETRHFRIERRHYLVELLDQRHFEAAVDEVLHHLQPDESAPNHDRTLRFRYRLEPRIRIQSGLTVLSPLQPLTYVPGIRHGPHREDPREIYAGKWRPYRRSTWRKHKLVIGFRGDFTRKVILELHGFLFRRDADHLAVRSAIDGEHRPKRLLR